MSKVEVAHPKHYVDGREFEPIDVIRDWGLNFNLGNAVKYISRAGRKDSTLLDLEKARFYITHEIDNLQPKSRLITDDPTMKEAWENHDATN